MLPFLCLVLTISLINGADYEFIQIAYTDNWIQFGAFDNHYKVVLHQNTELFSPHFFTEIHHYDRETQHIIKIREKRVPDCYYTIKAVSVSSIDVNQTHGILSLCNETGVNGWFHALGETYMIEPASTSNDSNLQHILHKTNQKTQQHYNEVARRMSSERTRYVELAVVNDPAMISQFVTGSDYQSLQDKTVSIVSNVQSLFLNTDWATDVGEIKIILSAIIYIHSFDPNLKPDLIDSSLYPCNDDINNAIYNSSRSIGIDYCTIDYNDYLSNFQSYIVDSNELMEFDNVQLFSYYDFGNAWSYASRPGMCIRRSSSGISQMTFDNSWNSASLSFAIGTNFNMWRDGNANNCNGSNGKYIFAAGSDINPHNGHEAPTEFSECSIAYLQDFVSSSTYSATLQCLDNIPEESIYAVCGNGIKEQGEDCDCGINDCSDIDPCCDGIICAWNEDVECSNDDLCCNDCKIVEAGTECRALNGENTCDIEAEVCDGISSECPPDTRYIEGVECRFGDANGYCYDGECISIEQQCQMYGSWVNKEYVECTDWKLGMYECGEDLVCAEASSPTVCISVNLNPEDGTPCIKNDTSLSAQCIDSECEYSNTSFTYLWTTYSWSDCSIACKEKESDDVGIQTRNVVCQMQDGSSVDSVYCNGVDKPIESRKCNNFLCRSDDEGDDAVRHISDMFFSVMLCATMCVLLL